MNHTSSGKLLSFIASHSEVERLFTYLNEMPNIRMRRALSLRYNSIAEQTEGERIKKEVEILLDFYGKVFIGALSGYFPYDLSSGLKKNIEHFLNKESVREYYTFVNKKPLIEGLRAYCNSINQNTVDVFFNKSMLDHDVFSRFLVFDYGFNNNMNVSRFLAEIKQSGPGSSIFISQVLNQMPKDEDNDFDELLSSQTQGALDFLKVMGDLSSLITSIRHPVLQSCLWHNYCDPLIDKRQFILDTTSELIRTLELLMRSESKLDPYQMEAIYAVIDFTNNSIRSLFERHDEFSKPLKKILTNEMKFSFEFA